MGVVWDPCGGCGRYCNTVLRLLTCVLAPGARFGNTVLVHLEDMSYANLARFNNQYRGSLACFSDDVQVGLSHCTACQSLWIFFLCTRSWLPQPLLLLCTSASNFPALPEGSDSLCS